MIVSRRTLMLGFGGAGIGILPKTPWASELPPPPDPSTTIGESLPVGAPTGPLQDVPRPSGLKPWALAMVAPNVRGVTNIIYRVGDTYSPSALQKLSIMMRDCHEMEWRPMSPRLFDILAWLQAASNSDEPITLTSGYRTRRTEQTLFPHDPHMVDTSPHTAALAADIRIPGVPAEWIREAALSIQAGGVGWYPRQQFVHVDSGPVRHWIA